MKRFSIILLCGLLAACNESTPEDVLAHTFGDYPARYECMRWQGRDRCYYVVPPSQPPSNILVALHPAFTPIPMAERISHLARDGVAKGYVVVYPEGIDRQWNDGRAAAKTKTYREGVDDVGFLTAMMQHVQQQYGLAPAQTAMAGMSAGGMMTLRMACQSDAFARGATVVANLPKGVREECTAAPKSLLVMAGTADDIIPFAGGVVGKKAESWGEVESFESTLAFFAEHNRCDGSYATDSTNADIDQTTVHAREYACDGPPLRALVIEGMGHTWPGEDSRLFSFVTTRGPISNQIDAGQEILGFFSAAP